MMSSTWERFVLRRHSIKVVRSENSSEVILREMKGEEKGAQRVRREE
jgi:hypothetical protein